MIVRAGHRRRPRSNPARMHHRRRHNPGRLGALIGDASAVGVGFFGSKIATQAVMGANNTGMTGYLGNGILAIGLGAMAS